MSRASAAHFAYLRRLAFTREVQQMAVKFVKYGSAAYFFRTYVMGVTAVIMPVAAFTPLSTQMASGMASLKLRPSSAVHRTKYVSYTKQ